MELQEAIVKEINTLYAQKKFTKIEIQKATGYNRVRIDAILKGESNIDLGFMKGIIKLTGKGINYWFSLSSDPELNLLQEPETPYETKKALSKAVTLLEKELNKKDKDLEFYKKLLEKQ